MKDSLKIPLQDDGTGKGIRLGRINAAMYNYILESSKAIVLQSRSRETQ